MPILKIKDLVVTPRTKEWCFARYPGHPKGCPNAWGRCWGKDGKYPMTLATDIINIKKPMYIVYNEYSLADHMERMKAKHPEWGERMLRNVLYWQPQSRKGLHNEISKASGIINPWPNESVGEGNGVNFYVTCFRAGLKLETIRTLKICRHMVLLGYRK